MRNLAIIAATMLVSTPAFAGGWTNQPPVAPQTGTTNNVSPVTTSQSNAAAQSAARSVARSNAASQSNSNGVGHGGAGGTGGQAVANSYGGNYRAAASSAVGIGSTNNPCGSVFGLGAQGIPFGVSLGIPFVHESCNTRITALSLDQCRSRSCRIAVGLADPNVRRAMEAAGEFVVYGPGQEVAYQRAFVNYQAQTQRRIVRRKPCRC